MIVVKIEVWPLGNKAKARPLGEVLIANDATGTADRGNYIVGLTHAGPYHGRRGFWRSGRVAAYRRKNDSPYHLLSMALNACLIRIPGEPRVPARELRGLEEIFRDQEAGEEHPILRAIERAEGGERSGS